jgi:hypothetical protein
MQFDEFSRFVVIAVVGVAVLVVGAILFSFYCAVWLRVAARWLNLGAVPYMTAFRSAFLANLVVWVLLFSTSVSQQLTIWTARALVKVGGSEYYEAWPPYYDYDSYDRRAYPPPSPISPLVHAIVALLLTAAILGRTIPSKDGQARIAFGDALALAGVYYALVWVSAFVLAVLATWGVLAVIAFITP